VSRTAAKFVVVNTETDSTATPRGAFALSMKPRHTWTEAKISVRVDEFDVPSGDELIFFHTSKVKNAAPAATQLFQRKDIHTG